MTVQERREKARRKRQRQVAKRKMILLLGAVLIITIGSIVFGSIFSAAKEDKAPEVQYKYYKSIVIEKGDSLWSIASDYCTDAYEDTNAYIDELKQLNGLQSETIHEGQHLVVAYFDTEYR